MFAYAVETACDKHGWILDYTIHPGNEHDSVTFPALYEKLKLMGPKNMVLDAGYKSPATAKLLIDDGVMPVMPYTRPRRKEGFFSTRDFAYDEYYDCYLCPNGQVLKYSTTNRDGYREYKSNRSICGNCTHLQKCTASKNHQKVLIRHIWQSYLDICEDIRLTPEGKDLYSHRKETIERCFGTAKEHHAMRYTQQIGKEKRDHSHGSDRGCCEEKTADILRGVLIVFRPPLHSLGKVTNHVVEHVVLRNRVCIRGFDAGEQILQVFLEVSHEYIPAFTRQDPGQVFHMILQVIKDMLQSGSDVVIVGKIMGSFFIQIF